MVCNETASSIQKIVKDLNVAQIGYKLSSEACWDTLYVRLTTSKEITENQDGMLDMTLFVTYTHRRGNEILIKKPPYLIFDSFRIFNSKTYPRQIHVYVKLNFWRENSNYVDCQLKHLAGCIKLAKSKKENS